MTRHPLPSLAMALALLAVGCAPPGPVIQPGAAATPGSVPKSPVPAQTPAGGAVVTLAVANAGFENAGEDRPGRNCPPQWWCTMHSDPSSFRFASVAGGPNGRFLRGERLKDEPWALVTQVVKAKGLEGRVLRVSSDVNAAQLKNGDGAGPVIRVYGPGGRVVVADKALRSPGSGWGRASVELTVPAGAELIDIGVVMYGDGIADFDNVAAEHRSR